MSDEGFKGFLYFSAERLGGSGGRKRGEVQAIQVYVALISGKQGNLLVVKLNEERFRFIC